MFINGGRTNEVVRTALKQFVREILSKGNDFSKIKVFLSTCLRNQIQQCWHSKQQRLFNLN